MSLIGTFLTWGDVRPESVVRLKAEIVGATTGPFKAREAEPWARDADGEPSRLIAKRL